MREILAPATAWARAGRSFALATVVAVRGSAPREVGASMIVSDDGEVRGNVSGGCVDGAVYERCVDAIDSGASGVESYGIADADAFAVGLMCGGGIDVLVQPIAAGSSEAQTLLMLAEREARGMPTTLLLNTQVLSGALQSSRIRLAGEPGAEPAPGVISVEFGAPPHLIIVGAIEFSVALCRLGLALGFRVTVVDPRDVFAASGRFPGAEIVVEWPDRYLGRIAVDADTAICVLTHDDKLDGPALRVALASRAGYVGAMGSRRTHEERMLRLAAAGVPDAALARLRSPIGLDLGGHTPDETALSILAEIVADRRGGSGQRLSERVAQGGHVHGRADQSASAPASVASSDAASASKCWPEPRRFAEPRTTSADPVLAPANTLASAQE